MLGPLHPDTPSSNSVRKPNRETGCRYLAAFWRQEAAAPTQPNFKGLAGRFSPTSQSHKARLVIPNPARNRVRSWLSFELCRIAKPKYAILALSARYTPAGSQFTFEVWGKT